MVAQGYAKAYRQSSVLTASPGQLVLLLFDGALGALAQAQEAFKAPPQDFGRIEKIHKSLTKAQRILSELRGTLNLEQGGEFARTMHGLYSYHIRRLFEANVKKEVAPVIEVEGLLREIRDAWEQMLRSQTAGLREGKQAVA